MPPPTTYVYIAGPLSANGNPDAMFANVHEAIRTASDLLAAGLTPYVPHLSVLWAIVTPTVGYEDWMRLDFDWIARCDAVLRLPGESKGADREVERARELHLPVFYERAELLRWAQKRSPYQMRRRSA